jgi:hypothetical protein
VVSRFGTAAEELHRLRFAQTAGRQPAEVTKSERREESEDNARTMSHPLTRSWRNETIEERHDILTGS